MMLRPQNIFQFKRLFMAATTALSVVSLFIFTSRAQAQDINCPSDTTFVQTIEGSRAVGETELLSQNHNIGLYRGGAMTLKPWVDIGEKAVVGIDQNGNVAQVLEFIDQHGQERRVGAILSHGKKYKSVFLTQSGQLFAIDTRGELNVFNWDHWRGKKFESDFARIKKYWAMSVCGLNAVATIATLIHSSVSGQFHPEYLMTGIVGTVALSMTHLTLAARKYEVANEATNGFVPTGIVLDSPLKSIQYIWKENSSGIKDFELTLESRERVSLVDGINRIKAKLMPTNTSFGDFDVKCEHALLARGIPEEKWTSK